MNPEHDVHTWDCDGREYFVVAVEVPITVVHPDGTPRLPEADHTRVVLRVLGGTGVNDSTRVLMRVRWV